MVLEQWELRLLWNSSRRWEIATKSIIEIRRYRANFKETFIKKKKELGCQIGIKINLMTKKNGRETITKSTWRWSLFLGSHLAIKRGLRISWDSEQTCMSVFVSDYLSRYEYSIRIQYKARICSANNHLPLWKV